jgi:hypothetical protein
LGKLNSFKNFGALTIPPENVIKFNNSKESLEQFVSKLKKSDRHFHQNLEEKANEILKELPGDFKRQDAAEGTENLKILQFLLEMQKEENK